MHPPGSKTKQLAGLFLVLIVLVSVWWFIHNRRDGNQVAATTTVITDAAAGLRISIPSVYRPYSSNQSNPALPEKGLIGNYVRTSPAVYLTLRYDTGLTAVTNLLHRGTLEHIEAEIAQFFPVKYGSSYRSIATTHLQVAGHESIDHRFSYKTVSGQDLNVRLIAIPFSGDAAYYLILQAAPADFESIQADLDLLKDSLRLTGPKAATKSS